MTQPILEMLMHLTNDGIWFSSALKPGENKVPFYHLRLTRDKYGIFLFGFYNYSSKFIFSSLIG